MVTIEKILETLDELFEYTPFKYGSDIDKILSALYMIVESSDFSDLEISQIMREVIQEYKTHTIEELFDKYKNLLSIIKKDNSSYQNISLKNKIFKRILFFKQLDNIIVSSKDLELFLELIDLYGLFKV